MTKQLFGGKRAWVNWKYLLTYFSLLGSQVPTASELAEYRVALTQKGQNQEISCSDFVKVPAWFDKYEGRPDHSLLAQWREEHR